MVTISQPEELFCSCCGACTTGRQYWNRDEGYGLCKTCMKSVLPKLGFKDFTRNYGTIGFHIDPIDCAILDEVKESCKKIGQFAQSIESQWIGLIAGITCHNGELMYRMIGVDFVTMAIRSTSGESKTPLCYDDWQEFSPADIELIDVESELR